MSQSIETRIVQTGTEYPRFDYTCIRELEELKCQACKKTIGLVSWMDPIGTGIFCTECGQKVKEIIKRKYTK